MLIDGALKLGLRALLAKAVPAEGPRATSISFSSSVSTVFRRSSLVGLVLELASAEEGVEIEVMLDSDSLSVCSGMSV
jgi:hypothetical protein